MQQCERDRLRAVKKVLLDFTAGIGRTLNNLHQSVQRMAFHESLLDPIKDLDYLIERYKTGPFAPKPVVYMGFSNLTVSSRSVLISSLYPLWLRTLLATSLTKRMSLARTRKSLLELPSSRLYPLAVIRTSPALLLIPRVIFLLACGPKPKHLLMRFKLCGAKSTLQSLILKRHSKATLYRRLFRPCASFA